MVIAVFALQKSDVKYTRAGVETPLVVKDSSPSILFVGDIMLGRHVEDLMQQHGAQYPFDHVKNLLSDADSVVANLEGPIMESHIHTPSGAFGFSFSSTTSVLLATNHISLVTLANNHTADFGVHGYEQTAAFLDKAGIAHVGHPYVFNEQYTKEMQVGEQHILYIAFNITNSHFDTKAALTFVKNIQRKPKQFIVALVHGGTEYKLHSDTQQEFFYRGLIDSGVDLVIAHHPHVVEEIEVYKNKPIFYSLGNFIFDQYFSQDVQQGLGVKLTLSDTYATYELIPLVSKESQPEVMSEAEKVAWLKLLADRSSSNIQKDIQKNQLLFAR